MLKCRNINNEKQKASRENKILHRHFSSVKQDAQGEWSSAFKTVEDIDFELQILSSRTLTSKYFFMCKSSESSLLSHLYFSGEKHENENLLELFLSIKKGIQKGDDVQFKKK